MSDPTTTTNPPGGGTEPTLGDRASDVADTAKEHASGVAGAAKEQGADVARSAVEHARTVVDSAGEQVQKQGEEQAARLADSLSSFSSDLRSMAEGNGADRGSVVGDVARSLAESTDRVAGVLRDEGPSGVMRRASDFGREHPVQFLALAAGAGFALARVVRNSDARRLQQVAKDAATGDGASGGGAGVGGGVGNGIAAPGSSGLTGTSVGAGVASGSADPTGAAVGGMSTDLPASAVGP